MWWKKWVEKGETTIFFSSYDSKLFYTNYNLCEINYVLFFHGMNRTFVIYFYLFLDFRIGDFTLISILCEIFLHAVSRSDVSLILGHPVYVTGTFVGLPAAAATFFLLLPGLEFRAFKLVHDILEQISRPIFKVVYFFSSSNNSFRFKRIVEKIFRRQL